MSKRPKIILNMSDINFMFEYLKKKNIDITEASRIEPPYRDYDMEFTCSTEDVMEGLSKGKFSKLTDDVRQEVLKEVGLSPNSNGTKIKYRFHDMGETTEAGSACRMIRVVQEMQIETKSGPVSPGKFSFTAKWRDARTPDEFFSDQKETMKAQVKMLELMQISHERAVELVEKDYESQCPMRQVIIEECSRKNDDEKELTSQMNMFFYIHAMICLFLAYFKPEVLKVASTRSKESEITEKQKSKKKKKKTGGTAITVIQMSKFVTEYKSGKVHLPRRRCAYAFQVRGHFRTYKSGKKVWIKEYTKNDKQKRKKTQIITIQKDKGDFLDRVGKED